MIRIVPTPGQAEVQRIGGTRNDPVINTVQGGVNVVGSTVSAVSTTAGAISYVVNNAKYSAIWVGLFVLGLVLIIKGLGVSTPSPSKIVPVPV